MERRAFRSGSVRMNTEPSGPLVGGPTSPIAAAKPLPSVARRPAARALFTAAALALAPLCIGASGCANRSDGPDAGPSTTVTVIEPVPAPPGLMAEGFVPSPDATWTKLRATLGGPALILPQSFGGLVTSVLGLPLTLAGEIDGGIPVLGAVLEPLPGAPNPRAALGIHVKVGERLIDQLTRGESARFIVRLDTATSIALLEPKSGAAASPVALGVLGNYLLIAATAADLLAAGPYVARTMPKSPVPKEDVAIELPEAALSGPISRALQSGLATMRSSGRLPILSLPVERMATYLASITPDLAGARLTLRLDAARVRARLSLNPKPGGGPATEVARALVVGDTRPLRELPADALAGLLMRASLAERTRDAESWADVITGILGESATAADRAAIAAALKSLAEARGDLMTAGMSFGPTGPVAYVRGDVTDGEKLDKAIKEVLALATLKPLKSAFMDQKLKISTGKTVVEGIPGDVQRITLERLAEDARKSAGAGASGQGPTVMVPLPFGAMPTSVDLFYRVADGAFFGAAGLRAKEGLRSAIEAIGKEGFGGVPEIKASLDAIGGDVSFALVVDPLRLVASASGKPGAASSAPVLMLMGRGGGDAPPDGLWMGLDAATLAIQEFVKHRSAF